MLTATFWTLVGIFVVMMSGVFVPVVREIFRGPLFPTLWILFFLLGAVLIFLTIKKKIGGRLKKFLILTGASAAGFFVSVLLHNFFYALAVIARQIVVLNSLMEIFHVAFFIVAIFVCPIGFLIGVVGSIVLFFVD